MQISNQTSAINVGQSPLKVIFLSQNDDCPINSVACILSGSEDFYYTNRREIYGGSGHYFK